MSLHNWASENCKAPIFRKLSFVPKNVNLFCRIYLCACIFPLLDSIYQGYRQWGTFLFIFNGFLYFTLTVLILSNNVADKWQLLTEKDKQVTISQREVDVELHVSFITDSCGSLVMHACSHQSCRTTSEDWSLSVWCVSHASRAFSCFISHSPC